MRVSDHVRCEAFPCHNVQRTAYVVPSIDLDPALVTTILVSEAAPADPRDDYYAGPDALFAHTTVQAFRDAGAPVNALADVLALGVYLTTAVKCGKTGYGIASGTIKECSRLLERELALFPNVKAVLAMGDVAIKAVNAIAGRRGLPRPVPAGSTYKLRGQPYLFGEWRVFPSYLQAGPAFFIEKSKRQMIAEDIEAALRLAAKPGM